MLQAAISKLVNSLRTYAAGPHFVRKVYGYSSEPVTSVHSRTFATFATAFAILRLHMVFNMHNHMVYRLNVIVQAVFVAHSTSEWLIKKWDDWLGLRANWTSHIQCGDLGVDGLGVGTVCELSTGYENRALSRLVLHS